MKITGYRIQQALRERAHARDLAENRFTDSLKIFPGDPILHDPEECMAAYVRAEREIAQLQALQGRYNAAIEVDVQGEILTLNEAVKMVGSAGRIEKMWRNAAFPKKNRYYDDRDTRDASQIVAIRTLPVDRAAEMAQLAARRASALREAIQVGNATVLDLDFPFPL